MALIEKNIGLYTDHYELTMAQGYFLSGMHEKQACFDYFFRKIPFEGGFVVFSGLSSVLEMLENFRFDEEACDYLSSIGFNADFIRFLKDFSQRVSIYSVNEGEIIFPNEPVLRVEGNILEAQLIETLLLNILNFESLVATKACRIRLAAGDRQLLEFGLRRAQGFGGINATKAAISGGFDKTSNVYASSLCGLESSGTMAHSWIQSFGDELAAFRTYARHFPDNCTLLVDTYDTLKSGVPNAITVALELQESGHQLAGIRLDSGDFSYLSKQAREMLDRAGLHEVKIVASNQLDEHIIQSLLLQDAPIDVFGVGTSLVTGKADAALDGIYKLSYFDGQPSLKISENIEKMTLPGIKNLHRFTDENNFFVADGISLAEEDDFETIFHPFAPEKNRTITGLQKEKLIRQVFKEGKATVQPTSPQQNAAFTHERLKQVPEEHKRFLNPHVYKVGISGKLMKLRDQLAGKYL